MLLYKQKDFKNPDGRIHHIWEKLDMQLLKISELFALFAVSSVWIFENGMFQQIYFQKNLFFFVLGETRIILKSDPGN